ncbi:MAG: hypothetical protein GXO11_00990 [Epsilonproteobacteria bacterium]|nr:hypothetical protein [Campylobacterota bacterium]
MKLSFFLFFFLTTLLYSKNPTLFKEFGDPLYNNIEKIEKLKQIDSPHILKKEIKNYLENVKKVKEFGNTLSSVDQKSKSEYFKKLRELATQNDIYVEKAQKLFDLAIQENDLEMFSELLQTGLIDLRRHEKEIFDFYKSENKEFLKKNYIDDIDAYKKLFKNIGDKEKKTLNELRLDDLKYQNAIQKKLQKAIDALPKEE